MTPETKQFLIEEMDKSIKKLREVDCHGFSALISATGQAMGTLEYVKSELEEEIE